MTTNASECVELAPRAVENVRHASHTSDLEMVEAAKKSVHAFAPLYELHYEAIANYLFRRTANSHATEDLLSEVFLAALRSLHRYQSRGKPFRAWLYQIANNVANKW